MNIKYCNINILRALEEGDERIDFYSYKEYEGI